MLISNRIYISIPTAMENKSEHKFLFHRTSNFWNYKEIEIKDMKELLDFIEKQTCWSVVIEKKWYWKDEGEWVIEDYNDYRE
jgi:hypothetical protein